MPSTRREGRAGPGHTQPGEEDGEFPPCILYLCCFHAPPHPIFLALDTLLSTTECVGEEDAGWWRPRGGRGGEDRRSVDAAAPAEQQSNANASGDVAAVEAASVLQGLGGAETQPESAAGLQSLAEVATLGKSPCVNPPAFKNQFPTSSNVCAITSAAMTTGCDVHERAGDGGGRTLRRR